MHEQLIGLISFAMIWVFAVTAKFSDDTLIGLTVSGLLVPVAKQWDRLLQRSSLV